MAARIKKGDLVEVISGDSGRKQGKPGHIGKVLEIDKKSDRVIVEGANRVWKHVKPNQRNPQGGRIQKEASIHISNVMPVDPKTGRGARITFVTEGESENKTKTRTTVGKKGAKGTSLGVVGVK